MAAPARDALRPLQLVLAVGAVLLVGGGANLAAVHGGGGARAVLGACAAGTAALSLRAGRAGLRSSAETLAACAVGLAAAGSRAAEPGTGPVVALVLAAAFVVMRPVAPAVVVWPVAAWFAAQLAGLRAIGLLASGLHTAAFLGMALAGLGVALFGRPLVARVALVTATPWWLAGVATGTATAWTGDGGARWAAAGLVLGAAGGLLPVRLRRELDPLTGRPEAIPVLGGAVAGLAAAGAFTSLGAPGTAAAAYLGVLVASVAAAVLDGWPRGLFLPSALACGGVLVLLSLGRLTLEHQWTALSALLVLASGPAVLVAFRRAEDRPVAVPVALGCLSGAVLLGLPGGLLTATGTAVGLTGLYAVATLAGPELDPAVRRPTEATAAVAGLASALLLAVAREWPTLALDLAVLGACTIGWAWRAAPGSPESRRVWPAGSAQLVAAAWLGAASSPGTAGGSVLEAYSLPLAAGLLLAAGPRLAAGPSWPTCGPALLAAALPSTALVLLQPGGLRPVVLLLAAAAGLLAGAWLGLRAPVMVGAGTAVVVGLRLSLAALPWPVTSALALGAVLLAVGVRRERFPAAFYGARLADLR